ncbi:unnamed protein product [Lactuca virosa]|uniref:SOSEKI DIX-like domain-containing protein n=1 Tax=Lactuca virosa TaxID=75947 RepID=A0AAU9NUQ1_9ASTR|nr:unnamed protein product [Lactuca virosa]
MQMQQQLQSSTDTAEVWKERCDHMYQLRRPEPEMEPKSRKVPVIYYLCRNRQLEHPHFIEVPLVSPNGLYLRDVIEKFDALRGKGMSSMYSWSSKRNYKNAFVWNDLSEDDLIFPAHGNEYVLKGSELIREENNPGRFAPKLQNSKQDDCSSSTKYKIYKSHDITDASTQTDEFVKVQKPQEIFTRSIESLINDSPLKHIQTHSSPPSSSCSSAGKADTLESLIRADVNKLYSSVKLEEEQQSQIPVNTKLRASNKLLQLISCGTLSSEDDNFCRISSFRSRSLDSKYRSGLLSSSVMLGELECSSENKDYLLLKKEAMGCLKRSSSYAANRINKRDSFLTRTKCKKQSKRMESFRENKENVIKIEESLLQELESS